MSTNSTSSPSDPGSKRSLSLRDIVFLGLAAAIIIALKEAMSFLPNIEPVTLLLICVTLTYGAAALYPCMIFVLAEGLLYGFGWYFFVYVYIWPILVILVLLLRRRITGFAGWAIFSALFGLCFGPLCCLEALVVDGWRMAFSFWISGIPFDVIHCVGNGVLAAVLLKPLTTLMQRLAHRT